MAATSSQEEVLDCELAVEDEGEISEDLEDDGDADLNADNLEGTTDEDENNDQEEDVEVNSEEEIEVDQPDVGVEDNSSEPSSSTGTRQPARPLGGPGSGYEQDPGDTDSVVPTTPKLPLPRRNDGFAEAVSSPQVPSSQDRFVFGSGQPSGAPDLIVTSSNSGLQGQEGLDRTAMDIQVFARGGAEPAQQQNVPAFAVEEEEINIDESEEGGVSSIVSSSEQQGAARPGRGSSRGEVCGAWHPAELGVPGQGE